jgi:hypothetical protein
MADNFETNAGSGGNTYASDDIASVHYPRVKISWGVDGAAVDASNSDPFPVGDAGGSLTVDNAALAVTGGGVEASALRVTLANDSTGVISVDDNGGSLTVDGTVSISGTVTVGSHAVTNAGTFAVQVDGAALTSLQLADDVVFADDAAFTLASSKVAMAGAIRDDTLSTLTAAEGDAVPLRVSSTGALHVTGAAGTTQYAEDAAHSSGDSGVVMLAVRRDSAASSSGTDGDYSTINTNATGALRVTIDSITGSQTDDAAFTPGTSVVSVIGGEFDDTAPDSVDEGDAGALRMSANRNLYTTIRDAAGNERGANVNASGQLNVTGPVTNAGTFAVQADSVIPGTGATNLGKAEDGAHTSGDVGVMALAVRTDTPANRSGTDGDYEPIQISAGRVWASATVTSLPASTNTLEVVGDAADDAAAAGNPVLNAGYSIQTDGTDPGVVSAESDVATLRTDMQRNLLVNITHPRLFRASADYASAQTNATVQAAPGAGLSLYVTDVIISNGATAGNITLLDGSGGTVLLEIYPAVNGGVAHSFRNPLRLTANTLLAITSTTVTTHSVTVTGYIAP